MFSWELVRHEMELSATPRPGQLPTLGTIQQRIETLMHMQPHNERRLRTLKFLSDAETQPWPAIPYRMWIQALADMSDRFLLDEAWHQQGTPVFATTGRKSSRTTDLHDANIMVTPGINRALPFSLQQGATLSTATAFSPNCHMMVTPGTMLRHSNARQVFFISRKRVCCCLTNFVLICVHNAELEPGCLGPVFFSRSTTEKYF